MKPISRVKQLRSRLGMSQIEFALLLDMSQSFEGRLERGLAAPNETVLEKLGFVEEALTRDIEIGTKVAEAVDGLEGFLWQQAAWAVLLGREE